MAVRSQFSGTNRPIIFSPGSKKYNKSVFQKCKWEKYSALYSLLGFRPRVSLFAYFEKRFAKQYQVVGLVLLALSVLYPEKKRHRWKMGTSTPYLAMPVLTLEIF